MKANEIRDLTTAEIEQKVKSLKEELLIYAFNWRLDNWKTQLASVKCVKQLLV